MRRGGGAILGIAFLLSGCMGAKLKQAAEENTLFSDDTGFVSQLSRIQIQGLMAFSPEPSSEAWEAVASVVRRLEAAMERKPAKAYRVFVVEARIPNAFSLPSYEIYVTRAMLELVPSEDVLAFILGHEIGHRELQHYRRMVERFPVTVFGAPGHELEADRYGRELALRAGYRVSGAVDFFRTLQAYEKRFDLSFGGFLSSHPATFTRLKEMEKGAASAEARESGAVFRRMKESFYERRAAYQPPLLGTPRNLEGPLAPIRDSVRRIQTGLDVALAEKALGERIAQGSGADPGAVREHYWLARLRMIQGRTAEARQAVERGIKAKDPSDRLHWKWLSFELLAWEGEVRAAVDAALETVEESPECAGGESALTRLCLELALDALPRLRDGFPEDGPEKLARVGERYLALVPDGPARSHAVSAVSAVNVTREKRDRITLSAAARAPEGLSAQARDWLSLESDLDRAGRRIEYRERGVAIAIGSGISGFTGALGEAVGGRVPLTVWGGVRSWPWEFGMDAAWMDAGDGVFPGGDSFDEVRLLRLGLYAERQLSPRRLRPFTRLGFRYLGLERTFEKRKAETLTGGLELALGGGLDYRLSRHRSMYMASLRLTAEGSRVFTREYAGREMAALGWQLGLSFVLTEGFRGKAGNVEEDIRASDPYGNVQRRPPHFF